MRIEDAAHPANFPSKRDTWITVVVWLTAIMLFTAVLDLIDSPLSSTVKGLLALAIAATAVLSIWILYSTGYTLTSENLFARCGPFTTVVSLDAIEGVSPSRSPVASPACSLDRLYIRYRGSALGLLVSPRDKRAFLQALVDRCPSLMLSGDAVVKSKPPRV